MGAPAANAATPTAAAYGLVPASARVCPVRVVSTDGDVSNPRGALCGEDGSVTLTKTDGGPTPRIVLDYGKDVGGIPFFNVTSASGAPILKVGYSETSKYLTDDGGDFPPVQAFGNGEGDPSRSDTYTVNGAGVITNRWTQGGERYEVLTLTSPGSVTIESVGVKYIADRTQVANYGGSFLSSDDTLNKVWYSGAYTAQLDAVPAGSLPGTYRIENGVLAAWGGTSTGGDIGFYRPGTGWTDYTSAFEGSITTSQLGWAVRSTNSQNGIVFLLGADGSDNANRLRAFKVTDNGYQQLDSVQLPFTVKRDTFYKIATTAAGSNISVSIDGRAVLNVQSDTFAAGSVGFRQFGQEEARFRKLTVTSAAGEALLSLKLNVQSQLKDFRIPGTNDVPSVLDGAKRDRLVWSGDLDTAGPTLAYTLGDNSYTKGSLELFATRQHDSGFIEGVVPPTYPVIDAKNLTSETGAYSATYSMYFVLGMYDYLLYSGDRDFATKMWPKVQKELAWNASRLDSRGLFITREGQDGADWDFYDRDKGGAITAYNAIYYRVLKSAAYIAGEIGHPDQAADYTAQATKLRAAINANMYDADRGLYRVSDNYPAVTQDANALTVLAGIPDSTQIPRILAALKTTLWTNENGPLPFSDTNIWRPIISTFISGYEAQARYASGDDGNAEQLIKTVFGKLVDPSNPSYTGTMWENVAADGSPGLTNQTSLSHAWATGGVTALSGYVLGIRPIGAGYDTWVVEPHAGSLSWAKGKAPTPHGALGVDWTRSASQFQLRLNVPTGTSGTVRVPIGSLVNPVVTVDGKIAYKNGAFVRGSKATAAASSNGYVSLTGIGAGNSTVVIKEG